jgi:alpha-tubulin suppressor-like RCC1 family protein
VQVVAEKYNSCAVLFDGTVRCWGDNNFGQLGEDGELQHESPAVEIVGISQATAVAVGARHVCALISTGEVYCWGDDSFGQLGYGKINSLLTTEPVQVKGISTAVEISSSGYYTCARLADGTVSCWGNNSYDQLGDGSHMNQPSPVAVQSLSGVLQISVGSTHACAVTSDTKVRCWGDNGTAQLGDGSTTESAVPKVVGGASPLSNVTQVSAGQYFSCARSSNGTVSCWGNGGDHVLGTTDGKQSPSPISQSVPLGGVLEVTSAEYHSCVRYTNNSVACWGIDDAGELGSMLPIALSTASALSVALPSTVTQLNAGGWHTCAILANQQVWCWGFNNNGQLGASPGAGNGPLQVMW